MHYDKKIENISLSIQRKLTLAMSLIGESKILILDEPTAGLDIESRTIIISLLKRIKKTRTIILTT